MMQGRYKPPVTFRTGAFFFCLAVALLIFIKTLGMFPTNITSPAEAQAPCALPCDEVLGWAWSGEGADGSGNAAGGTGWISFNSRDCDTNDSGAIDAGDTPPAGCPPVGTAIPDYAVRIPSATGGSWPITGYAWAGSNNDDADITTVGGIGWIRFNPANISTDPPPGPPLAGARVNILTGAVTGWARACSVYASGCSGVLKPADERGNWDGWVKMAKDPTDAGAPYGVLIDINNGNFSGYAWGGGDPIPPGDGDPFGLGWIDFRPAVFGGVDFEGQFNHPPVCNDNSTGYFANEDANPKNFPVLNDCSDPDLGDVLTIDTILTPPTNGSASIVVVAGVTQISYRPNINFVGTDSIKYQVNDGRGLTASATITFPVYDCGNNALDPGEECDTSQFGGETCRNQGEGFVGGDLTCTNDQNNANNCNIDTSYPQCRTFRDVQIKED